MKYPKIIIAPRFLKAISWVVDVYAITLFPFIVSRDEMSPDVLLHESIHIAQQKELFVVFFYILYGWDFLKGLIKYRDRTRAYYQIRFEQEAYEFMYVQNYIENRPPLNWKNYRV